MSGPGHNADNSGFFQARTFTDDDGLVPGKFQILASSFTVVENPNGTSQKHTFSLKNTQTQLQ
jgi:hypothetical protein